MKIAAKNLKNYLIALILVVVACGVSFAQYYIVLLNFPTVVPWNYMFILLAFGVLYVLIGWIIGDAKVTKYRHKSKDWNGKAPEEIKNAAWQRRYGPFLAGAVLILFTIILELVALARGTTVPF